MSTTQTDLEDFTTRGSGTRPEPEVGGIAADRLRSIVERHERLTDEITGLKNDQRDLLQEAASAGFDKKALMALIRERAAREKNSDAVDEQQHLLDLYRAAIGG